MSKDPQAYLLMIAGSRIGSRFPLKADRENLIGRGLDCDVILSDAQCSRVHAKVAYDEGWWLYDCNSRNGTLINGQKTDDAQLFEGTRIAVGSTVFAMHLGLPDHDATNSAATQTIVMNERVDPSNTGEFAVAALQDESQAEDFLTLYQLAIRLLGSEDPDEVIQITLDLLHERTRADVVGFLWISDVGQLKPKFFVPGNAAESVTLSETLTELVMRQGHAVRLDNQSAKSTTASLSEFTDTICIPLIHEETNYGAIHLYKGHGCFRDSDFEVSKSAANILAVALARARRLASLSVEYNRLVAKNADTNELVGESKPMTELKSRIERIAHATGCVLVRGESGSGKELVARALHRSSPRANLPMLSVNCAAIPAELMESQLFGHKKGSFTSAESDHIGWFQQADAGTLFLDEVGELTLEGQAKLLRILDGYSFLPVGGTEEINVDVRVIAATNRDLSEFVKERRFREDLYYRLSVFELHVPPLRDRGSDIELLIEHFLEHFRKQHGRPSLQLSKEARTKLLSYQWPGNVRQLRNVIDSAVVMAVSNEILEADLALRDTSGGELESLKIDHWERKLIKEALSRTNSSVPEAAKLVGLGRATLYRKIEDYGIRR